MNDPHMTAKVLRRAAEIVEQGWCQVDFRRLDGAHCAVGAIIDAQEEIWGYYDPEQVFEIGVATRSVTEHWCLMIWNDIPGRTQAEVADALRRAADLAEGETERSDAR